MMGKRILLWIRRSLAILIVAMVAAELVGRVFSTTFTLERVFALVKVANAKEMTELVAEPLGDGEGADEAITVVAPKEDAAKDSKAADAATKDTKAAQAVDGAGEGAKAAEGKADKAAEGAADKAAAAKADKAADDEGGLPHPVSYFDANGEVHQVTQWSALSDLSEQEPTVELAGGCYVVSANEDFRMWGDVRIVGDVRLIMAGKVNLCQQIFIEEGATLHICSATESRGEINSLVCSKAPAFVNRGTLDIDQVKLSMPMCSYVDNKGGKLSMHDVEMVGTNMGYGIQNEQGGIVELRDQYIPRCGGGGIRNAGKLVLTDGVVVETSEGNWWEARDYGLLIEEGSDIDTSRLAKGSLIYVMAEEGTPCLIAGAERGAELVDCFEASQDGWSVALDKAGAVVLARTGGIESDLSFDSVLPFDDDSGIGIIVWTALSGSNDVSHNAAVVGRTSMVFEVGGKAHRRIEVSADQAIKGEGPLYGFRCPLTVVEMAEPVKASLGYDARGGRVVVCSETHSLKETLKAVVDTGSGAFDNDMARLMANLGHHMQPFLAKVQGWKLGEDYQDMDLFYEGGYSDFYVWSMIYLGDKYTTCEYDRELYPKMTCKLTFGSLSTMDLYITPAKGTAPLTANATFGGRTIKPQVLSDGRVLYHMPDITPEYYYAHFKLGEEQGVKGMNLDIKPYTYLTKVYNQYKNDPVYTNALGSLVAFLARHVN